MTPFVLIDLSSIAFPIWHITSADPNPNKASIDIIARVRSLASGQPYVAICCDKGKSFRHDLSPTYKANRPERDATLHHQIALSVEALAGDGFPIWAVPGFEADDLIATACAQAMELGDCHVTVVSADKDLLQLVGPDVTQKHAMKGDLLDADAVQAKFGVLPSQIRDYLSLVGDASDNVTGARGIGPKRAAELLTKYQTIEGIYAALDAPALNGFTPAIVASLREFQPSVDLTRSLITLRTDAEIPFSEILTERTVRDLPPMLIDDEAQDMDDISEALPTVTQPITPPGTVYEAKGAVQNIDVPVGALVAALPKPQEPDVLAPAPAEWERQLEPRSMRETMKLAEHIHQSRLFSAYGTPQAVLTTLLAGRELGMQAMASLRGMHIIDGKPTLPAAVIVALVLRSGKAKYFRCTERTAERATFETQRNGDPPISLAYTIQEARQAWPKDDKAFVASGWGKNPADMLVARASSKLARLVFPDVVHGIYDPDELAS
jgi:5'-3' exonuclease